MSDIISRDYVRQVVILAWGRAAVSRVGSGMHASSSVVPLLLFQTTLQLHSQSLNTHWHQSHIKFEENDFAASASAREHICIYLKYEIDLR